MSSQHHDAEYIALDSSPGAKRRSFSSTKYAGHLFLAAVFFSGILLGGGLGRWFKAPNVITLTVQSPSIPSEDPPPPIKTIYDAFTDINHASPAQYPALPTTKRSERAVVTSLYTEGYSVAVATLGHALTKAETDARKIVIYLPERISHTTRCYLREVGWELFPVDLIEPPNNGEGIWPYFIDQYTKLRIWTLDTIGVKAAVYIDADTLVRRNFDELFELPFVFAASPDVYMDERGFTINFNAGVMALKPNSSVFADMLSKVESAHFDRIAAEQSYLNLYYGSQVLKIPHVYNGNLAIKTRAEAYWNALQDQLRIIHYTLVKPFNGGIKCAEKMCSGKEVFDLEKSLNFLEVSEKGWGGAFKSEIREWGGVFEEMMKTIGDKCLA